MGRVVGIISGKGGVGKTTVTINLGAALVREFGEEVLIIDCNVTSSHIGIYLGITYPRLTLREVLSKKDITKQLKNVDTYLRGLKILPASISFVDGRRTKMERLERLIRKIEGKFDFILLDSSPGIGKNTLYVLKSCEDALFITTPSINSLLDILRINELVKPLKTVPLGVVVNMVKNLPHELKPDEIEEFVGLPVVAEIPFDRFVLRSLMLRVPVVVKYPNSRASKSFIKLAEFVMEW